MHRCRRTLVLLPALCLAAVPLHAAPKNGAKAPAAKSAAAKKPAVEVSLEGAIQAVLTSEKRFVLVVEKVTTSDGTTTQLDPPRPKTIVVTEKTVIRTPGDAASDIPLSELRVGQQVTAVGVSEGEGKPLVARAVTTGGVLPKDNLLPVTTDASAWTWTAGGASKGAMSTEGGALKVAVETPGATEGEAHVGKGGLNLRGGHPYRLRFRARADAAHPLRITSTAGDRNLGLDQPVDVGEKWRDYDIVFTAKEPSENAQNSLQFLVGGKARTVWIADASLVDATPPITDPQVQRLVAQLRSPDKFKRKGAADSLKSMVLSDNKDPVAHALVDVLGDSDLFVRWAAVAALGVWATEDTVPALIKMLNDPEHAVRWATMESLAKIGDPRAAEPLALMVDKGQDRGFAANALRSLRGAAEPFAVKLLESNAWEARMEGAKILADYGTPTSVPALRKLIRDSNGIVRMGAEDALKKIAARTGQ